MYPQEQDEPLTQRSQDGANSPWLITLCHLIVNRLSKRQLLGSASAAAFVLAGQSRGTEVIGMSGTPTILVM